MDVSEDIGREEFERYLNDKLPGVSNILDEGMGSIFHHIFEKAVV